MAMLWTLQIFNCHKENTSFSLEIKTKQIPPTDYSVVINADFLS